MPFAFSRSHITCASGCNYSILKVRQRLALVAIEENDIAGLGLGLAQLKKPPKLRAPSAALSLALTADLPAMSRPRELVRRRNHS